MIEEVTPSSLGFSSRIFLAPENIAVTRPHRHDLSRERHQEGTPVHAPPTVCPTRQLGPADGVRFQAVVIPREALPALHWRSQTDSLTWGVFLRPPLPQLQLFMDPGVIHNAVTVNELQPVPGTDKLRLHFTHYKHGKKAASTIIEPQANKRYCPAGAWYDYCTRQHESAPGLMFLTAAKQPVSRRDFVAQLTLSPRGLQTQPTTV